MRPILLANRRSPLPDRVVLVPCSGGSARQWTSLTECLDGFQVQAIDLWGHGPHRRWHGSGPLSLAEEAAGITEACPDGPPFHLVGHSYGGGVALRFALNHPERLRSLTLIEPSAFHLLRSAEDGVADHLDEIRSIAEALNRGVLCGDYAGGMERFIDYWSWAGSWKSLPMHKRAQLAQLAVTVAHHFCGLIEETVPQQAYADLQVPTLILCGTLSPAPSRAIARILADRMPRARHRTIRNAGHMSPYTHAAAVNALIREHLLQHAGVADRSSAESQRPPADVA